MINEYDLSCLQQNLGISNLMVPGRRILFKSSIEFSESSSGFLYLFSDSLLLTLNDKFLVLIPNEEIKFSLGGERKTVISLVWEHQFYKFSFVGSQRGAFLAFFSGNQTKHKVHWENYEPESLVPSVCLHASVFLNGFLYTFGGKTLDQPSNTFQKINIFTGEVSTMACQISPRFAHSLNIYKNKIILFGGRDFDTYFNDLWTFDGEWQKLDLAGPSRAYHSACISEDSLVIFGGRNEDGMLNSISIYHFLSGQWKTFYDPIIPPIENCFAFSFSDFIFFLGGRTQINDPSSLPPNLLFNIRDSKFHEIHISGVRGIILNFEDKVLVLNGKFLQVFQLKLFRDTVRVVWEETFDVSGQYSSDLKQATAVFDDQNRIIVYGGINAASVCVSDIKKIEIDDSILFHQDNSSNPLDSTEEVFEQVFVENVRKSTSDLVSHNSFQIVPQPHFELRQIISPKKPLEISHQILFDLNWKPIPQIVSNPEIFQQPEMISQHLKDSHLKIYSGEIESHSDSCSNSENGSFISVTCKSDSDAIPFISPESINESLSHLDLQSSQNIIDEPLPQYVFRIVSKPSEVMRTIFSK